MEMANAATIIIFATYEYGCPKCHSIYSHKSDAEKCLKHCKGNLKNALAKSGTRFSVEKKGKNYPPMGAILHINRVEISNPQNKPHGKKVLLYCISIKMPSGRDFTKMLDEGEFKRLLDNKAVKKLREK